MIRALAALVVLAGPVDGCACGATSPSGAERRSEAMQRDPGARGTTPSTSSGSRDLGLLRGLAPTSDGGKCTATVTSEVDVRDLPGTSLEAQTFGTRTGQVSARASREPCP